MTECGQTRTDTPSVSDEERQRIERMLRDIVCRLDADAADADFYLYSAARLLQTRPDAPPLTPRYERQARQWKQLLERLSVNERLWSAAEREAINELDAVSCFWLWTRSFICCLFLAVGLVFLLRLAGADAALWSLAAWPCAALLRRRLHRRLEQAVPMRQIPAWLDIAGWGFLCLATLLL